MKPASLMTTMTTRYLLVITVIALLLTSLGVAQQSEESNLDLERIQRATVFIIQAGGDDLSTYCVGSGTIVRYDGLILTNAHTVVTSDTCPGTEIIVAVTTDPNQPPVPKYRADIVQVDEGLDLALLRITREEDGRAIEEGALPVLPFVELADSNTVQLDETITVVGYPSFGNDSIASIVGTVTGFIAEPSGGDKSWFKTTTVDPIPGIVSGGGAYNQQGQLIGVPTTAPVRRREDVGTCQILEDTNNDGFINRNDACVPTGESISVLRPSAFARPLIRSASLELDVEQITVPRFQQAQAESETITRMYFATAITNDLPTRVVSSAPTGTTSLYLFFDYRNFTSETVYEIRVNINGSPSQTFSLPPVRWSGAGSGLWYVGSSGQPYPNGDYEFRLFVNGIAEASRSIRVGGVPETAPSFSNVAFGFLSDNNNLRGESYILPRTDIVSARFIYSDMEAGTPWSAVWYYNGVVLTRTDGIWDAAVDGENGLYNDLSIQPEGGLPPGNYRVDLGIGENARLVATGDFVVAGTQSGVRPRVFSNIEFYRAASPTDPPSETPADSYPDGANTIYARFDWENIASGTLWTMQWTVDDNVFYEVTSPWNAPSDGEDFTVRLTAPQGLPDATYELNLLINGILLQSEQVNIGIGQLEIDELARPGAIQLRGQIVDGATKKGIEGATFVLIKEDFSIADFVWDQEQIYALAVTDRKGNFEIDRSLEIGSPYSVYILAEGYLPITRDGFTFSPEILEEIGGSPVDMYVPMLKD